MVSTGDKIAATDYNAIQSLVNQVLGVNVGGALYGYGQNVSSVQVSANSKITTLQWSNLRNDILRCRQHQTGTDLSGSLTAPGVNVVITATDREAYLSMIQTAALDANRLAAPPSNQASREPVVTNQVKTTAWNGTITQTVTVTFPGYNLTAGPVSAADHIRCYFNAGGRFEFSSSLTGGNSGTINTKDYSWKTILSAMGEIYFNRDVTTCTGTGTTFAVGYNDLTTSDKQIFQKDVTSGYTPNRYRIFARAPSATQIVFTIYWEDLATSAPNPNPPWDIDENVTGTITSIVNAYRPSGTNVSIPMPSGSTTSF